MKPLRPYLIRAVYDWVLDNGCTPYMLVDAEHPGTQVPRAYVQEGKIIFNLRPEAVHALVMGQELVEFRARFGGVDQYVCCPVASVLALYAQETGRGMVFTEEEGEGETPPPAPPTGGGDEGEKKPRKAPFLRVVK